MTDATLAPADQVAGASALAQAAPLSRGYTKYALVLLLCIYVVNFLDRQVVTILAEPIKKELGLADWQIGMMSGFAFAIFYTVLGLPIARLAERKNRPLIIASALTAWSGFTALCGTAQSFTQLCLYRVGVGVGEAGCTPPAHSLITDYTPRAKRASALSFYSMGVPIGSLLGMAMGGIIADQYGWRVAFFVAGAPGLVLAAIAAVTLKETRSKLKADVEASAAHRATIGQTMAKLAQKRTFWLLSLASATSAFILYGNAPFLPAFFLRNHPDEVAALAAQFNLKSVGFIGLVIGVITGVVGALSSIIGGWIADRMAARDIRDTMIAPTLAALIGVPSSIVVVLIGSATGGLWAFVVPACTFYFWYGPVYSTTQGIVPPHMRATAAAVLLFIINLIGLGVGPLFVGACSDYFAKGLGMGAAEGVRWALIVNDLFGLVAAALYWMARKTIREEMES
ncbi:MAG: MFS transporter [Caulobacteraceae bacterium]